jgi:HSP20 family protein
MAAMTQWDAFQDLRSAHQEEMDQITRLFAQGLGQPQTAVASRTLVWAPAVDISERKDAYLVTVEVPGVEADDLQITLEDGLLTIQGERHIAQDFADRQVHRVERRYGAFRRSITLPSHVVADAIEATVDNGVLQILVPKLEQAKPKRLQVHPDNRSGARAALRAPARPLTPEPQGRQPAHGRVWRV